MRFEWDPAKDRANRKKHGVGFDEAKALFRSDDAVLELYDDAHSEREERIVSIGPIRRGVIVVVWTERTEDVIRIISARFASAHEVALYRRRLGGAR